jgi:membrane protein
MNRAETKPGTTGPRASLKDRLSAALRHFIQDDGHVLAGHLAFMALLSLFPFLIFLVALAGYFGQTEVGTQIVALLLENLPESVAGTLEEPIIEVMQETRGGLLTVGIIGALWSASNGLESIRTALNRAYGVPAPPKYWRRRLESVLLVILAAAVIVVGMVSLVFGAMLWKDAQAAFDFTIAAPVWALARYGLSTALLFIAIVALYWVLPARRLKWRRVLPGAFLALLLWLVAGTLFSLYLSYFNQYALTYGSLGGVMIAMVFFYILGLIFIFGAEFNAAIARERG